MSQGKGSELLFAQSISSQNPEFHLYFLTAVSENETGSGIYRDIVIPPDYLTDFETWPPVDWNLAGGTYSFTQHTDANGNNWAKANFFSQVSGTSIMTTPPLQVTDGSAQLRFTWSHLYYYLYPNDALSILVSNNLTSWSQFWFKTGADLDSNDSDILSAPGSGVTETIDIPSAYTDSTFWIRFVASSGYGRNLFIDNVIVRQTPVTPLLIYAPSAIDFSLRAQNLTAGPLNLTIKNDGIDTLFIAAADLSIIGANADQFSFSSANLPAALLYGESVTIPVFMTPTSTGMKNGTLRIVNNQTRTDYDIPVRGEGADSVVFMYDGFTNAVSGEVYGFYDSGGPDTDYSADEDYVYTFYPPPGMLIQADFLVFSLENNYDLLYVYSGESAECLLLGTFTGSDSIPSIISAAGPLTFRFTSDDSVQKPGWIIRISSVPSPELPPAVVVLLSPPEQASGLPVDGFDLIWSPGPGGGVPSTYDVFLSDNLDDIGQYVWTTSESRLNPATAENPVAFTYNLIYYWTVQAFNQYGFSEPAAIQSFRIELSPAVINVTPVSLSGTLTHPDSLSSSLGLAISNQGGRPLSFRIVMSETTTRASDSGFVPEIVSYLPDGQAVLNAERSPLPIDFINAGRALFDLQFSYPTYLNDGEYGIATDGNYFYTTDWSSNAGGLDVAKYNLDGSFVSEFTITGAGSVRDLAYDGQYFYGAAVETTIYKMDFTAETLIGTFTAPVSVRAIAYDSEADAFWVGNNWNANLRLVDRTGAQILSLTTAVGNIAGLAYDNVS
ncbi:MAG: choice-of-anchor D domain-containing protein, partial [Candidatus Cloacimonadaceae bacterium]